MNHYEILDKKKHRQLRVLKDRSEALGDAVMNVMTYPIEFRDIQSCYPILFTKDPATDAFFASALFGFEHNQNLFLNDDKWKASYIPIMVRRQPFMIATHASDTSPENERKPVVSIDRSHPRVSESRGEALFLESGEPSDYLQGMISLLDEIHRGMEHHRSFINALLHFELLESITLDFTFNDGSKSSLQGFHTIDEERLYKLPGNILEELNQKGYLQPIFMAVASLSNVRSLLELKNARSRQSK